MESVNCRAHGSAVPSEGHAPQAFVSLEIPQRPGPCIWGSSGQSPLLGPDPSAAGGRRRGWRPVANG